MTKLIPLKAGATVSAALVLLSFSSYAEVGPLWETIGYWQIRVDRSVGNGCFMLAAYRDGSVLRVGFDRVHSRGYIMVANERWSSLEIGKEYPISLQFDRDTPWEGNALATTLEGGDPLVLELPFNEPNFLFDLARKQALYVTYTGKPVTSFPLTGSVGAVASLLQCENQLRESAPASGGPATDPFANGTPKQAADPFR